MSSFQSAGPEASDQSQSRQSSGSINFNSSLERIPVIPERVTDADRQNDSMLRGGFYVLGNGYPPEQPGSRIPVLVSDDIITGSLTEAGRMSPVRRFFCLLVTFDLLFTGLLWLITVIVTGRDMPVALHQQVLEYTIYSSMFDCVMCAALRFLMCIIFYALFDLHHWWPIALTTGGTSVFLVVKVFNYQWNSTVLTFEVLLVLLSFILAWGELWFLDFRVLPLESKAREVLSSSRRSLNSGAYERTPLLPPPSSRSAMIERYMESTDTASVAPSNFYSLYYTPDHSDEESQSLEGEALDRRNFGRRQRDYKPLAKEFVQTAWNLVTKSTDWKLKGGSRASGDKIESRTVEGRSMFLLTGTLEIPARLLLEELFYKAESSPNWNRLITECSSVMSLDSNTDIVYQVCAPGGGGVVTTRDFVYLRHWELIHGAYVSAHVSIAHCAVPPRPDRVRGESGPCCFMLRQSETQANKCSFQWLLNTDLKISIPKFVLDKAVMASQHQFMESLRRRVAQLKNDLEINPQALV